MQIIEYIDNKKIDPAVLGSSFDLKGDETVRHILQQTGPKTAEYLRLAKTGYAALYPAERNISDQEAENIFKSALAAKIAKIESVLQNVEILRPNGYVQSR